MKPLAFLLVGIIFYSCNQKPSTESVSANDRVDSLSIQKPESKSSIDLHLHGTWFTKGNHGLLPYWLEFDSTKNESSRWIDQEVKSEYRSISSYKIINDSLIEFEDHEFGSYHRYYLEAIADHAFILESTKASAGGLRFDKTAYTTKGKIIFFQLSEQEYDSLIKEEEYQGLSEVSSDFGFYVSRVIDSLKNSSIRTELNDNLFINIEEIAIDKFRHNGYGAIFIKSDSMYIHEGISTDLEYHQIIKEFFE